jgi:SAM-dependent methyltransferase
MIRSILSCTAQAVWKASCIGCPPGETLDRYSMYRNLRCEFDGRDLGERVLSISHSKKLCEILGARERVIVEANYPEQSLHDLHFPSQSFTAVVSDQVFEHIACTPDDAVNEVYRVLEPGGLAVHTTCFLIPYHGANDHMDLVNGDFWRFTPSGLRRLHKRYSEVITANGWGHPLMPLLGGLGLLKMPVPETSWHPLNRLARLDRKSYAYTVWVVAKK